MCCNFSKENNGFRRGQSLSKFAYTWCVAFVQEGSRFAYEYPDSKQILRCSHIWESPKNNASLKIDERVRRAEGRIRIRPQRKKHQKLKERRWDEIPS